MFFAIDETDAGNLLYAKKVRAVPTWLKKQAYAEYGITQYKTSQCDPLVRRVLYDDLPQRPQIPPGRLIGTRGAWMTRYAPLLDAVEFTKFVTLTKDLSPFVLLLIDPQSRSRRQDRNPAIARENLIWVINGHPDAVPLFQ